MAGDPPKETICCVNAPAGLAQAWRESGHRVLDFQPPDGEAFDVAQALGRERPGLVLQVERLGRRVLLRGLDRVDAVKAFWAVDPHLNAFWQAAYGRLFDMLLSTQAKWQGDLSRWGAPKAIWLPWFCRPGAWTPWERRHRHIGFVGRVTPQRPARVWLTEFLSARHAERFHLAQDLSPAAMLDFYASSRLVPNECIADEVNFRLFEAASRGCLVLNPALGPELAELFEPGREIETFENALELQDLLDFFLARPAEARLRGLAAWERTGSEHTAGHRADAILKHCRCACGSAARGAEAGAWATLAEFCLWEAGRLPMSPGTMEARLLALPAHAPFVSARIRFRSQAGQVEALRTELTAILAASLHPADPELNCVAAMAALRLSEQELARQFWYRLLKASRSKARDLMTPPEDPVRLCRLMASLLRRCGLAQRPGFPFDPQRHVAASALECLVYALSLRPGDVDTLTDLDALLAGLPGMEQMRVGFLSDLTLRRRDDWRLGLTIGLADLKAFRPEAGLEEVLLALDNARRTGQEKAFARVLAAGDRSGRIRRSLGIDARPPRAAAPR